MNNNFDQGRKTKTRRVASPTSVPAKVLNKLKKGGASSKSEVSASSTTFRPPPSDRLDDLIVDRNKYWLDNNNSSSHDGALAMVGQPVDGDYGFKRRVEKKTTKNTEKRVRRQVVLADGRIYRDRDPDEVIVDRIDDHEVKEEEDEDDGLVPGYRQEGGVRRRLGYSEEDFRGYGQIRDRSRERISNQLAGGRRDRSDPGLVKDQFKRTVNTHEAREKEMKTEASNFLGKLSRKALDKALRENRPLSEAIELSRRDERDEEEALRRREMKRLRHQQQQQQKRASNYYDYYSTTEQQQRHSRSRQQQPSRNYHFQPEPDYGPEDMPPQRPRRSKSSHSQHRAKYKDRDRDTVDHHQFYDEYTGRDVVNTQHQQQHHHYGRHNNGNYTESYADPQYLFENQQQNTKRKSKENNQLVSSSKHHHGSLPFFLNPDDYGEPKVVYSKTKSKKVIDTEDVHEIHRRGADGKIHTETYKTQEQEVIKDDQEPESGPSMIGYDDGDQQSKVHKESQRYEHRKQDDYTDFFRVDHNGRKLEFLGHGPHVTTEERTYENDHGGGGRNVEYNNREQQKILSDNVGGTPEQRARNRGVVQWEEISDRIKENREMMMRRRMNAEETTMKVAEKQQPQKLNNGAVADSEAERKDALTKEPLNIHKEEKTRRIETDNWLERHFGSDWSLTTSSNNSSAEYSAGRARQRLRDRFPNHTIARNLAQHHKSESRTREHLNDGKNVRRSMSFNEIPIAVQRNYNNALIQREQEPILTTQTTTQTKKKKKVKTTTTTVDPLTGEELTMVERTVERSRYPSNHHQQVKSKSALDLSTSHNRNSSNNFHHPQNNLMFEVIAPPPNEFRNENDLDENFYRESKADRAHHSLGNRRQRTNSHSSNRKAMRQLDGLINPDQMMRNKMKQRYVNEYGESVDNVSEHQHFSRTTTRRHHTNNINDRHHHQLLERSRSDEPRHSLHQHQQQSSVNQQQRSTSEHHSKSRRIPIVEEKYPGSVMSNNTSKSSRQKQKQKRKTVYRSESARRSPPGMYSFNVREDVTEGRTPRYITEFKKEKLFPALSENNLLFSMRLHDERSSRRSGSIREAEWLNEHHLQVRKTTKSTVSNCFF